ncbi:MAG: DUF1574 family protein [Candidatus Omnitrophota bacterium]|nr:DUF1574 family protein [Candidatus Omnitrophota bacterium]
MFLPIIIMVTVVNYICDPAQLFTNKDFEKQMARLFAGSSDLGVEISDRADYDDRYFQKAYVENLKNKKDVLVLGSSTVMYITSEFFPNKSFFNAWVSAAGLNDQIAIYGLYRQKGFIPSQVILGVDPWSFDKLKMRSEKRWQRLKGAYGYIKKQMNSSPEFLSVNIVDYLPPEGFALFSASYFQASVDFFLNKKGKLPSKNKLTDSLTYNRYNNNATSWADGSRTLKKEQKERPASEVEAEISSDANNPLDRMWVMDGEFTKDFADFIALLEGDKVKVIIYLPPYHPLRYRIMNGLDEKYGFRFRRNGFEEIENTIKNIAKKFNVAVVGSYDPKKAHINQEQFIDGMHLRSTADVKPIFSGIGS